MPSDQGRRRSTTPDERRELGVASSGPVDELLERDRAALRPGWAAGAGAGAGEPDRGDNYFS